MARLPGTEQNEHLPIPEAVRSRLRELSSQLEAEHQSLTEARMLGEAEISSLKTELSKREEAWQAEKRQAEKSIERLKAENESLRGEREQWAAQRKEWSARVQQLMVSAKQVEGKEARWREEKLALENALKQALKEKDDLRAEHREAVRDLEERHQAALNETLDELELLLRKLQRPAA